MISALQAGGFGMVPTLAFGLLLLAVGVFHALNPERKLVSLFAILGIVDIASGVLGTAMGAAATLLHVAKLPESQQIPTRSRNPRAAPWRRTWSSAASA